MYRLRLSWPNWIIGERVDGGDACRDRRWGNPAVVRQSLDVRTETGVFGWI